MLVLLQRNWFGPNGRRFRRLSAGTEVPDEYKKILPKDAKILGEPVKVEKEDEPSTLSELSKKISPPGEPGAKQK